MVKAGDSCSARIIEARIKEPCVKLPTLACSLSLPVGAAKTGRRSFVQQTQTCDLVPALELPPPPNFSADADLAAYPLATAAQLLCIAWRFPIWLSRSTHPNLPDRPRAESRAAPTQPSAANIPSFSTRKPANIPLHTLSSSSRPRRSGDSFNEKRDNRRSSFASDSAGSEFSLWSDTGDLVDQLAGEEDPLAVRLRRSFEEHHSPHRRGRSQKKVRYQPDEGREKESHTGVVRRKEDIRIPSPPPRRIPKAEQLLAFIMAPNDGPSRMHGLHGKKLM